MNEQEKAAAKGIPERQTAENVDDMVAAVFPAATPSVSGERPAPQGKNVPNAPGYPKRTGRPAPVSWEGGERSTKQRDADLIIPPMPPPIGEVEPTSEQAGLLGSELWEKWFCRAMTSKENWMEHVMPILRKYFPFEAAPSQSAQDPRPQFEENEDARLARTGSVAGFSPHFPANEIPQATVVGAAQGQTKSDEYRDRVKLRPQTEEQ